MKRCNDNRILVIKVVDINKLKLFTAECIDRLIMAKTTYLSFNIINTDQ